MSFWRAQSKGGCRYGSWVLTCLAPLGWTGEGAGPHTLPCPHHSGCTHSRLHAFHSASSHFFLGLQLWGGFQKGVGVGVGRALRDLIGVADLDDFSPVHYGDAGGEIAYHWHGMRDEKVGQAEVALQLGQQVHDLCAHADIERGDWFVAHDEIWPEGESAGDAEALALSAGG